MYISDKYPYAELTKTTLNGFRKYMTPDGRLVPSVTTVLDATKPEEAKKALQEWRKRVGPDKAQQITSEAAGRGTRMHKWLETYVKTGSTGEPGTNPYSIQSHQMAHTIISTGLSKCDEFWGTEISLYFPEIYAGTTDLVGLHESTPSIIDFKQTNKPKQSAWITDYFIQLIAYSEAHNEVYGTKIQKGVILMCSKDNQYQEFIIQGKEYGKFRDMWWARLEEYYAKFM